jgi:hypothetical protein
MKRSIFYFALIVGFFSSCQPSIDEILKENDYAKSFDHVWQTLDANYPYFDYTTLDMDKKYNEYIRRAEEVSDAKELGRLLDDFLKEFSDPNILVDYPEQTWSIAYNIPTKDFPAYNLFANDLYVGGEMQDELENGTCTRIGPTLVKWVYRTTSNGGENLYPLILCTNQTYIHDTIQQQILATLPLLANTPIEGIVLDFRCMRFLDVDFIEKFVPYFYEPGTHHLYEYSNNSSTDKQTYTIEGNGLLANTTIAIIVNESTTGEFSWLARVLQARENIAIVGRAEGGPGCLYTQSAGCNGVKVNYPSARIEKDGQTFYDPLVPEIWVDWVGNDDPVTGNRGYPDNIDYCLVAALDFIDSYK